MNKVAILREKVKKLVSLLTEKRVSVTQRGVTAKVDYDKAGRPVTVNLPYIPEDADDEYIQAIEGFLDQQVARVLFADYDSRRTAGGEKVKGLFTMIEDAFVERKMGEVFRGSGMNLNSVGDFYLKNVTEKKLRADPMNPKKYLLAPMIRALSGQEVYEDYMDDKWSYVEDVMDKVGEYLKKELPLVKSSEDALKVARVAKKMLDEDPSDSDGEGEEEGESEAEGEGEGESEDGSGEGEGESSPKSGKSKSGKSKSGKSDKGESEDEGDSAEGKGESGSGDSSEDESEGKDEGESKGEEKKSPGKSKSKSKSKPKSSSGGGIGGSSEFEESSSFDEDLAEALTEKSAHAIKDTDYKVYSLDYDFIGLIKPEDVGECRASMVREMEADVDHMVGPMQKDIERIIAAKSRANWSPGHRSGRLNPSSLSKLALFGEEKVFRRRHMAETKDTAISLVIDCSGSMGGGHTSGGVTRSKIWIASRAAYGLSSVLERINVPHEIIGFTTKGSLPAEAHDEARKHGIEWSRNDRLYVPIFKSFQQRLGPDERRSMAALATPKFMCQNIDGECVEIAGLRLEQRKEKRRIMIVLSDGYPAGSANSNTLNAHLKRVVKNMPKRGVEVFGIGIASDAVKKFYPQHCVIHDVNELPSVVIGKMKEFLVGG
jgi:cobaltochelatase CobT